MKFFIQFLCSLLIFCTIAGCGQKNSREPSPFYNEIQNFKKIDSLNPPPQNCVLFVGSSSFRLWTDLEMTFKDYNAVNRGFGGATLVDAHYYAKDLIAPYNARQIVIYCGENDLPADTVTAPMLLERFKKFFVAIRNQKPGIPIAYVSIKPSPQRLKYLPLIKQCNALISDYLASQENAQFINVFPLLLTKDGKVRPELYGEDQLHMNSTGYEIWAKAITPYLIKE
jgi:lysophospholipase L1-like esterase